MVISFCRRIWLNDHQRMITLLILAVVAHIFILLTLDFGIIPPKRKPLLVSLEVKLEKKLENLINNSSHSHPQKITSHQSQSSLLSDFPNKHTGAPPAQAPKTRKRTISAAAHEYQDANYLARWQAYMEQFGNEHYPELALKNNLRGNLRLLVAIKPDGHLESVSLRQSSGIPVLDQAAMDLVKMAAPFEPLPVEMAQDIEILEIIRTWQFRGKLSTSS